MRIVAIAVSLFTAVASTAGAQDFSFIGDQAINMGSATLTQVMNNNLIDPRLRNGGGGRRKAPLAHRGSSEAGSMSFAYTPSVSVRRQVEGEIVGRLRNKNPEAARALQEQVKLHDFGRIYDGLTRPFGLRSNDAGDVLTAYTTLGYLIANNVPDPSLPSVRALRSQLGPRLAATPQFGAATTRAKLSEELKIMFVTLHAGWQSARREGTLKQYSDSVAGLFRRDNIDLRSLRLSANGLDAR